MVPLVDYRRELEILREQIVAIGERVGVEQGRDYSVGTMIELPRACLRADEIAEEADFFSFGTNDLTQTALGFSRDDIEGRILGRYIDVKVFDRSPFETLDTPGVGQLVRMGAWLGRKTKAGSEARGLRRARRRSRLDRLLPQPGIDYVSCSPYRVPVARVAAAQAAIRAGNGPIMGGGNDGKSRRSDERDGKRGRRAGAGARADAGGRDLRAAGGVPRAGAWSDPKVYEEAAADPVAWWTERSKELLDWDTPPTKGLDDSNPPFYKWFEDGRMNASAQCLDRHVEAGTAGASPTTGAARRVSVATSPTPSSSPTPSDSPMA